jgi:outer membrane protein assembly factor BamB
MNGDFLKQLFFFMLFVLCSLRIVCHRYEFNITWLSSVISSGACLGSLIGDPKKAENCTAWTRHEIASPLFDPARNLIYLGGSDGYVHIVSAHDGTLKKNIKLPEGNLHAKAVLSKGHLFFGTSAGDIIKLDPDTGKIVWKLRVDAEVENRLVLQDDTLFAVTGLATIYAIDAVAGTVLWNQKRSLPTHIFIGAQSNPLLVSLNASSGKLVLICGHPSGRVDFYEAETGKAIFSVMVGDLTSEFPDVASTPIYTRGSVVVASFNRGIVSLDPDTGEIRWKLSEKEKTKLAAAYGFIFAAGNKSVVGINAQDGRVVWRFTFDKGAPTDMIIKNGFLYIGSDHKALYVLKASTGMPVRYIGSGQGFVGEFDFSSNQLFAMSAAGYLYAISPDFKGFVQRAISSPLF